MLIFYSSVFATTYVVKRGETISSILYKFGKVPLYGENSSVEKTKSLNNLKDVNIIHVGQEIKIDNEEIQLANTNDLKAIIPADKEMVYLLILAI